MNWKLIFLLSLFGLAMGLGTAFFIPISVEPYCWLVVLLASAFLIARYAPGRYFLHGLLVSIINGLWITAAHTVFFYTYIVTHPEYLEMTRALPAPELAGHPRRLLLAIGPISGLISGLVLGLVAWAASKILKRQPN